ncbi:MAG: DUF4145 domain-containing protein [Candidatus Bathyarchaeota archaeon]
MPKIYPLYRQALKLREDVVRRLNDMLGFSSLNDPDWFVNQYDRLYQALNIEDSESTVTVPYVHTMTGPPYEYGLKFHELHSALNQMIAYMEGILGNIQQLQNDVKILKERNQKLLNSLIDFTSTEDFKIDKKLFNRLLPEMQQYLLEASKTYATGCYVACCSMCGNILTVMIHDLCNKNKIKYPGLAEGIKNLRDAGALKKPHEQLVEIAKYYRDHSAHPTSEAFTKDKARMFLSSLIVLFEEISK